jgi:hypothetical protein
VIKEIARHEEMKEKVASALGGILVQKDKVANKTDIKLELKQPNASKKAAPTPVQAPPQP